MKTANALLISAAISLIPSATLAYEAVIYNFSSKKIYFSVKDPSQYGKVKSFDSERIHLNRERTLVHVYTSSTNTIRDCRLELYEKEDVFVTDKGKHITCSPRAERLPKEF